MALLAALILVAHLLWIAFVALGAFWTHGRPALKAFHLLSLVWGIAVEISPWPCPLTLLEQYFEAHAGRPVFSGSFLVHYLDAVVYPDLPYWLVAGAGVAVCVVNIGIYGWRWRKFRSSHGK